MTQSSYHLAVDLGTSRIAAATARVAPDGSIVTAPFGLGRKSDSAATVVFVADDGELSFGDAAERRGVTQPERLIREFKRSIGDQVPISVDGRSFRAEHLYAQTVAEIIRLVTEREGATPEGIALTHPTAWGGHRIELIRSALVEIGVTDIEMITEPEAAARHYEAVRPLEMGQTLAVYDLGGGTFDSVLLRKEIDDTFDIVGEPVGIDDLGGADFDDAVLRHVIAASGIDIATLAVDDPDTRLALSQLRRECVDAKEALSFDSDATIPVLVPPHRSSVRLTRSEFEDMITGPIDRTIDAMDDALASAGLEPEQLESILLIGGSSRIPRVAQRLSERFDRPIAVDADPKAAIALGAARTALVRAHDRHIAVGTGALALLADQPAGALALVGEEGTTLAGVAEGTTFTAAPVAGASLARRSSPFLLAGAAVTIAAAIVFASTVSAGSRSADPSIVPASSNTSTPSPTASSAPAPDEAVAAPPMETVAETQPVESPRSTGPQNPRRTATQNAVEQSKSSSPTAKPTTPPTSTAQAPPNTSTTPTTTQPSTPPAESTTPSPSPSPTTPPAEPDPTTPPAEPDPTPTAEPDPTTPPAEPDPTTPPAEPDPTTPPAAPDPTTPPADPSPDPSPSPTEPV